MTQFEFILVFISIVLALGVSDVLSNWGDQIRFREQVHHYWLHTHWGILYLLVAIQAWWGLWRFRERTEWTFFDNLLLIWPYLMLALVAYVLAPSISNGQNDIKHYYYKNTPWIFGFSAVYVASVIINTKNALGMPFLDPTNIIRVLAIILMIAVAAWKNELFHKTAVAFTYVLMAAWIVLTLVAL